MLEEFKYCFNTNPKAISTYIGDNLIGLKLLYIQKYQLYTDDFEIPKEMFISDIESILSDGEKIEYNDDILTIYLKDIVKSEDIFTIEIILTEYNITHKLISANIYLLLFKIYDLP